MRDNGTMGPRARVGWSILWGIPVVAAGAGILFSIGGNRVARLALDADPCATSADNPFLWPILIAFAIAIGGSLLATVVSAIARNLAAFFIGVSALLACPFLAFLGIMLTIGGYGWHCSEY